MEKETVSHNMQTYDVLGNERSNAVENLEKMDLDTGGAIKKLAVALGVDWNAANAGKSVTLLKERIIHLLGGDAQGDLANLGKPCGDGDAVLDASTIRDTEDAEDTREELEEDVHVWCALYPAWTYAGKFRAKVLGWLDRQEAITERNCRAEYEDMREYLQTQVDGLEAKVDALESENDRLKVKVSNQRKELDTYQIMYDVEAVAQLKRDKKKYKGMYNAEHQIVCRQKRKLDRLAEENEVMRQALMDLGDILG